MSEPLVVDARVTIPATDLEWTAMRASGPGGQHVNKVSSKVLLRFRLEQTTALDARAKARLREIAASRIDGDGDVCVVSQATRDQTRNLEDARAKLKSLVLAALFVPKRRKATRPSRAAKARRLDEKRRQSDKKRDRRGDRD